MKSQIKIISVNINGINSKLDSLTHLLDTTNADVCLLQETKALHLNSFKHPNYSNLHLSGMDSSEDLMNVCKGAWVFYSKRVSNSNKSPLILDQKISNSIHLAE